eukprot:979994-Prymnesium_polylepis.1
MLRGWRRGMRGVVRQPEAHSSRLSWTASRRAAATACVRVRAYCGVFGWGDWSPRSEPLRL